MMVNPKQYRKCVVMTEVGEGNFIQFLILVLDQLPLRRQRKDDTHIGGQNGDESWGDGLLGTKNCTR